LAPVAGLERPVALALEIADDDLANDGLVVDDENSSAHVFILNQGRFQRGEIPDRESPRPGISERRGSSSQCFD
jgi:hypothetical protein